MKKIISLALVLVMVFALGIVASATEGPTATITTDKTVYEAGDVVTVTVTLDATIPESDGVTGFQHVLSYDKTVLAYVDKSVATGDDFKFLGDYKVSTSHSAKKSEVKCNWLNMDSIETEIPAGVMFTAKFTVLEATSSEAVKAALTLKCDFYDANSQTIHAPADELEVVICPGHEAGEVVKSDEKAADCTNAGSYVATTYCKHCEAVMATETVTVPALGHTMVAGAVTAPTCTTEGYTTYTCACGATEKRDVVSALGHTPGAAATCTTAQTCTVCNAEVAPAKGHTPGAAATCTAAQTCTACNAELAPAKGHTPGAAATCTAAQTCTVCNAELAPAKGHTPGAAATCTAAQTCTVCNAELAPAKGHTPGAAATCTAAQTCTVCNAELAPAKGHTYTVTVTEPTCTEKGVKTETCACGDVKTTEIPANGHTYSSVVTAPTCTAAGYTTYTCACGDTYKGDEVAAKGHTHTTAVTAPTCTAAGYTTYTCACGDTYKADEVAATGHADANNDHKCDVCEAVVSECADANKDHKCDVCTKVLSECADADNDSKCDHCGTVVTPPPATGDMISVVAAIAFVAAMSIVALPKAKKF